MIQTICTYQKARVKVHGDLTDNIRIEKGMIQSCLLSPLLFTLVLEVTTNIVRTDGNVKGTTIKRGEYKLQAFADSFVFILEEPNGKVAGIKVNHQKSKIIAKNTTKQA